MKISNSYELFLKLQEKELLKNSPLYWWPNFHSFEVVVGAILTQNTKWENVAKSLKNLKDNLILSKDNNQSLHNFAQSNQEMIASCIASSGFYRQKSIRLILLAQNILRDFGDFDIFVREVSREWLLGQKGIGFESADSILNYACNRDIMVVDKYTHRLVASLGFEFEDYESLREWCEDGIRSNFDQWVHKYKSLSLIFSRFHGKIVEFSKRKMQL
ncbi:MULTISPECIES: 3-methyladenine DNA glycosylase [unclassified Helicobacter]|uniref:3-methyladenine DNA glycosylase n=1 Tax=unclassified Helicobacter TaxID=2593540 RepID=UPI000CF1626E|nr:MULTISPECIES: 3-methyladenine DNA glycosylase [unclassified Helicobacter]